MGVNVYAIYNKHGDFVSASEQPDAVLKSVLLPPEIDSLMAASNAGYIVIGTPRQNLAVRQIKNFSAGCIIHKPINDIRLRKITRREVNKIG